jgi:hypothetical protein
MLRLLKAVKGPGRYRAKRDDFPFLEGRLFGATVLPLSDRIHTRLAGSLSEAQPPGAKMAVREQSVACAVKAVKAYSTYCGGFPHATRGLGLMRHDTQAAVIHHPMVVMEQRGARFSFDGTHSGCALLRSQRIQKHPAKHFQPVV